MDVLNSIQTQHVVVVGAGPDGAVPAFEEFAGRDVWGPMSYDEANDFAKAVKAAMERLAEEDPQGFVYGEIQIEVKPINPAVDRYTVGDAAMRAASNWWLNADGREAL